MAIDPAKKPVRIVERQLTLAVILIGCAVLSLAFLGGLSSWKYYLTVEECQAGGTSLVGTRVRVSGIIAPASLNISKDGQHAEFEMIGHGENLAVECRGPFPDNLAERVPVVVEGKVESTGGLRGERLMTRCASKYEATDSRPQTEPLLVVD